MEHDCGATWAVNACAAGHYTGVRLVEEKQKLPQERPTLQQLAQRSGSWFANATRHPPGIGELLRAQAKHWFAEQARKRGDANGLHSQHEDH